ncbi:MAG: alpha/beta fold hydrolase [bacterium]|nr:alpha/beta fold hydrolase [bacterium]
MQGRVAIGLALSGAALAVACGAGGSTMDAAAPDWVVRTRAPRASSPGRPPLLVLLHGIGTDENDLFPVADLLDPRFQVVSLRAPGAYVMGHSWFHIEFGRDGTIVPDVAGARRTLAELRRWLTAAPARFGTDPGRTVLLGFSQGAMMSLGVVRTEPVLTFAVVALSGRAPGDLFPPAATAAAVAAVPLFVGHGLYDDVLPVAQGRATREAFAGGADVTYREYPVAHGITDAELRDVAAWLTARLDGRRQARSANSADDK